MLKRLIASIAIAGILIAPVLADDLGPSTSNNISSDPSTLNALQPATPSGLQSADSQSGGVKQSGSATSLQPAGTKSDFPTSLDLGGVADGSPHSVASSSPTSHINQYVLAMIGILMLICAFFTYRISKLLETKKAPYFSESASLSNSEAGPLEPSSNDSEEVPSSDEQPKQMEKTATLEAPDPIGDVSAEAAPEHKPQANPRRSPKKKTKKPSRRKK